MVSAINSDQSDIWKLLMQNSQKSSDTSTDETDKTSEQEETSFSNLLQRNSESESVEDKLYEILTDLTQQMGVPAGMFINNAEEEGMLSATENSSSVSSSSSGSSSSTDIRDTNQDGVVSQEEIDAALGLQQDNQTASSKLKQQLETAYGLDSGSMESMLNLVA